MEVLDGLRLINGLGSNRRSVFLENGWRHYDEVVTFPAADAATYCRALRNLCGSVPRHRHTFPRESAFRVL
jgi:hypothetical protein